jgi:protein-L-isoaspartate(D-aspartate) O-methyltransferase
MVQQQLRRRGLDNERVLEAMARVRRHLFIPDDQRQRAYDDSALPIGQGQTISQPYMVGLMTNLLDPQPGWRVLEVGTGSGYQAAVLAEMGVRVVSIERYETLAENARQSLEEAGLLERVRVEVGDGTLGLPEEAPYQGILVTAASPGVPSPLTEQLDQGGRLVIPVGSLHQQTLMLYEKIDGELRPRQSVGCRFVPLRGEYGWAEEGANR